MLSTLESESESSKSKFVALLFVFCPEIRGCNLPRGALGISAPGSVGSESVE